MTRVTYKGCIWEKISKRDWEFEGGTTNPDLLKLPDKRKPRKGDREGRRRNHYFRLKGYVQ